MDFLGNELELPVLANEERMKGIGELLRDPQFVNASREEQNNQLIRAFGDRDPDLEI